MSFLKYNGILIKKESIITVEKCVKGVGCDAKYGLKFILNCGGSFVTYVYFTCESARDIEFNELYNTL